MLERLMIALVLLTAVVGVTVFWMLLDLVYGRLKPRLERWLWRKLGGQGPPPE